MARRKLQRGARNPRMPDAQPVRRRLNTLVACSNDFTDGTPEVPYYILGLPRGKGKKKNLNGRRNLMKARMEMRSGFSAVGCMPGSFGFITYPLNEEENNLLESMASLALGEAGEVIEPEDVPQVLIN